MLCQAADAARADLVRLASFSKWPVQPTMAAVSFVRLAAAGFRYTGDADSIVCGHCDTVVRGWLGTRNSPLLEHRCSANSATHHTDTAEHDTRTASTGSYRETVNGCRKAVPEPETNITTLSGDASACGSDAVDLVGDKLTRLQLEVDEAFRPPASAASLLSRQMETLRADDVVESTSGNARNAAAANLNEEEEMLMEENSRLRDAVTCKVCMENEVNTVFLPCGHLVSCDQCSPKLRKCPICRTYIRGTIKTIMF